MPAVLTLAEINREQRDLANTVAPLFFAPTQKKHAALQSVL